MCSPSGTSPLVAKQRLRAAEDDRVVVADRGGHQAHHVGRRRRRDDLEPGDRHRPVLDALAVLRPETQARAVGGMQHERQRDLAVGHVPGLGDLVGDHVPGHREEVAEHQLGDRPQPGHRRAHGRANDGLLADRRVADALAAEPAEQALGQLEHAAGRPDVLADEHHARVAVHLLRDRRGECGSVRQFRHDEPPSVQTWVSRTSGDGSGAARAMASASATAACVSASMASSSAAARPLASRIAR